MKKPKSSMNEIDAEIEKAKNERERHYEKTTKKLEEYLELAKNADTKSERKKYKKRVIKTAVEGLHKSNDLTTNVMQLMRKRHDML